MYQGVFEALVNNKSMMGSKGVEENRHDHHRTYSTFEGLQDNSKLKSVATAVYDSTIGRRHNFKTTDFKLKLKII